MSLKNKMLAYLLFILWWLLEKTYRIKYFGLDHKEKAISYSSNGTFALAIWHENIFTVTTAHAFQKMAPLASKSKDGDFVTFLFDRIGFSTARGSSSKGGREGLKAVIDKIREGYSPAISVDGPLGPRRKVKPGVVQISKRGKVAILPVCGVADRMWILKSWDQFRIPKPFCRLAIHYDAPLIVPEQACADEFDDYVTLLEKRLLKIEEDVLADLIHWRKPS